MKVLCKHCENLCKKFGRIDCDDYKKTSADDLEKEYRNLMQTDKVKAQEIKKKLDYFYYGIK